MFNNYVVISSEMINQYRLKGNELLVFAVIHSFSRDGKSWYSGSREFIQNFTGSSIKSIDRALDNLVKKQLIEKRQNNYNNNSYRVACRIINNLNNVDNLSTNNVDNLSKNVDNLSTNKNIDILKDNNSKLYTQENLEHLKHILLKPYFSSVIIEILTSIKMPVQDMLELSIRTDMYIKVKNEMESILTTLANYNKSHKCNFNLIIKSVDKVA